MLAACPDVPVTNLQTWASQNGVETVVPSMGRSESSLGLDIPHAYPFETSDAVDFGRVEVRVPSLVLRPRSVEELRSVLERATQLGVPVTTRGAGHSSGGQTLTWGVQIDLKGLNRVSLEGDLVRAQAGARWKKVIQVCAPSGRRPSVLIGSQEPTVGGTLSVGGFGDRTHRAGLQIDQVEALSVVTVDGGLHHVKPGDPLFDYVLAGRGQLGIIVEALYRTCPLPDVMDVQALFFPQLSDYIATARALHEAPLWDAMPAWWDIEDDAVEVLAGQIGSLDTFPRVDLPSTGTFEALGDIERVPVLAALEMDDRVGQAFAAPCLEVVAALPDVPRIFGRLRRTLRALELSPYLGDGVPLSLFRRNPDRPLAPAPKHSDFALIAAVRPEMPSSAAQHVLSRLRQLGNELMGEGACLYLMSVEGEDPNFLARQFGSETAEAFVRLKRRFDPEGRLNPWEPMQTALRMSA